MTDAIIRQFEDGERRVPAKPSIETATVPSDVDGAPVSGLLPPAGTVVVYFGHRAAPEWQRLRELITRGDWAGLRACARAEEPVEVSEESALSSPMHFEVRCAGRTLAERAVLPQQRAYGTLTFPYTGGVIPDSDFEIVEYRQPEVPAELELDYVIVRRSPELSDLERQLLGAIDPGLREIHVGARWPHGWMCSMDQITNDIHDAALHDRTQAHGCVADVVTSKLPEDVIDEIAGRHDAPAASVTELLGVRRRLLG
ncbi:hypothetical protein ACFVMC_02560 [Nocardia sp. NPDC127579]|uniref:hypothetical protein n=1 Tax=Nocardia sp. NPDC127579 TaxID=3345402 RepID=UPI00364445F9